MLNTITVATHTTPVVFAVAFAHFARKARKVRNGEDTGESSVTNLFSSTALTLNQTAPTTTSPSTSESAATRCPALEAHRHQGRSTSSSASSRSRPLPFTSRSLCCSLTPSSTQNTLEELQSLCVHTKLLPETIVA